MAGPSLLTVLADTGALYALADRDDAWHGRVVEWWEAARDRVVLPVTVLPELAYLVGRRVGPRAEVEVVRFVAGGELDVEPLRPADISRAADLMSVYVDAPLGFVDASVMAMAERLGVTTILTTDRRHFSLVRPSHITNFRLVP